MELDIAARTAEVLGGPQRLDPLRQDEITPEMMRQVKPLHKMFGLPPDAPLHSVFATLFRHHDVIGPYLDMGIGFLIGAALSPRHREMITLRTGWLCGAPYEWGEHVPRAKKAGMSAEEVEALTVGSADPIWNDQDRTVLVAVEELHSGAMICDATWAALAEFMDDKALIELPALTGHYHTVAFLHNALRFPTRKGNAGLAER